MKPSSLLPTPYPPLPTPYFLLPTSFPFSQSSLQDFDICPRRFELRYLRRLVWPAVEAEPIQEAERLAQLGTDFHRLVQQHVAGIPADVLSQTLTESDPALPIWWQSYLRYRPEIAPGSRLYPEVMLSTPLRGYRLMARFDLVVAQPDGTFLILDWKTTLHKPSRDSLAQRLQTRVYPYVLALAGAAFNGGQPIDPAAIQMIYWYPALPDQPERFGYSPQFFQRDEQSLGDLIERIKQAAQTPALPMTEEQQACVYCVYRSYCDRGAKAGFLADQTEATTEEIDLASLNWDQIAEIQF